MEALLVPDHLDGTQAVGLEVMALEHLCVGSGSGSGMLSWHSLISGIQASTLGFLLTLYQAPVACRSSKGDPVRSKQSVLGVSVPWGAFERVRETAGSECQERPLDD